MKSQRRHELEKNVLAEQMARVSAQIQPYAHLILAGVLLVAVAILAYSVWHYIAAGRAEQGWEALSVAMLPGERGDVDTASLEQVGEDFAGTDVGHWAKVIAADTHLNEGCDYLFSSRAIANQELRKAVELYTEVLAEARKPAIRERATFGLARALEAQGDLERARSRYKDVVQQWPEGPFTSRAQQRVDDLSRPRTLEFYDRFAQFDPQPERMGDPDDVFPFDWDALEEAPIEPRGAAPLMPDAPPAEVLPPAPDLGPAVILPDAPETPATAPDVSDTPDADPETDDAPGEDEIPQ